MHFYSYFYRLINIHLITIAIFNDIKYKNIYPNNESNVENISHGSKICIKFNTFHLSLVIPFKFVLI